MNDQFNRVPSTCVKRVNICVGASEVRKVWGIGAEAGAGTVYASGGCLWVTQNGLSQNGSLDQSYVVPYCIARGTCDCAGDPLQMALT